MQAARGASLKPSDPAPSPVTLHQRKRHLLLFALVAVLGYAADLGTKQLVLHSLEPADPVRVVGDVFSLFLTFNSGAAFSLGTSYTFVLSCIAILAALVTLWFARRLGSTGWALALGFLLAGITGNLTDRVFRAPGPMLGHVVDFLRFPNFPVFNVADICINIAAGLIILQTFRGVALDGTRDSERGSGHEAA
jgi:signal peptidase II